MDRGSCMTVQVAPYDHSDPVEGGYWKGAGGRGGVRGAAGACSAIPAEVLYRGLVQAMNVIPFSARHQAEGFLWGGSLKLYLEKQFRLSSRSLVKQLSRFCCSLATSGGMKRTERSTWKCLRSVLHSSKLACPTKRTPKHVNARRPAGRLELAHPPTPVLHHHQATKKKEGQNHAKFLQTCCARTAPPLRG